MKYYVQDKYEGQMSYSLHPTEFWFTTNLDIDPASCPKTKGQGSVILCTVLLVPVTFNFQESLSAARQQIAAKKIT